MILKYLLPLLALAGAALAAVEVEQSSRVAPPQAPPAAMPESPFPQAVAAVGLVEANTENISVGSETAGVVTKVFVKVGDRVRAGGALFQLDDRALRAEVGVKRAAVAAAKVDLANARFDQSIAEKLTAKNVGARNDLEEKGFATRKAEAALGQATADLQTTETSLALLAVRAPIAGEILQLKVHPGEFAPDASSSAAQPSVLIGNVAPLNLRAEFDESDAWRVRAQNPAVAFVRGDAQVKIPLTFVRFEPYVVPKQSLTGSGAERADTRVLQVIYALGPSPVPIYPGQQMDIYLSAAN